MFFLKTSPLSTSLLKGKRFISLLIALSTLLFYHQAYAADVIRIGSKRFTENQILATLTANVMRQHGYTVDVLYNIGTNHSPRSMLLEGKIDLYWEYTGTAYKLYLHGNDENIQNNPGKLYQYVKNADKNNGG